MPRIRQAAEENTPDVSQRSAALEFMNGFAGILRWMGSDDVHNPEKSPLNKHVIPGDIDRAIVLEKWLEENRGHEDYDAAQLQFMDLDRRIKTARSQALEEGGQYVFSLLKRMDPSLAGMENPSDIIAHKEKEWAETERQEFENYVLTEFGKLDIFEPNLLRSFWEKIERNQYGKVFYRIVCESFAAHQESPLHQKVQQIWLASHLDTIHHRPQEARTRMPAASIDGLFGPNFGYRMERSAAYQRWIENPLVRASGDVIMDAFHWVVDFGCALDEGVFLKRPGTYLWGSKKAKKRQRLSQNECDSFLIPFQLYLLENTFGTPFVQGHDRTIPGELKKADSKENLIAIARQALADFKTVARNMLDLRPDGQPLTEDDLRRGLVFGIGFNGKLFDSPNHSAREEDEIWLTFSDSRRDNGGSVFLSFLKHVAKQRSRRLTVGADPARNFDRYKPLIRRHLNQQIQGAYYMPDSHWDAHMLDYVQQERTLLEGFMSQLEQDIPFDYLSPAFKKWVRDASNWYSLPPKVKVQTAPDMPEGEHVVQYAARNLLFDALNRRSFSTEHPGLTPILFLHWKQEILEQFSGHESVASAIELAQEFEDFSDGDFQEQVASAIDELAAHVHPELRTIWEPVIDASFRKFQKPEVDPLSKALKAVEKTIAEEKKKLKGFAKAKTDVSSKIAQAEQCLAALEQQKQQAENALRQLPKSPISLSRQKYEEFRRHFFDDCDVSQCAEPLFSRVLGHDRFFSVFISKKSGLRDCFST